MFFSLLSQFSAIPDTSSFFKVSLKTNNKALALAVQAEKQKSMQLQTENLHLRREVQSACFDLATKKHNYRKLVRLFISSHVQISDHRLIKTFAEFLMRIRIEDQ